MTRHAVDLGHDHTQIFRALRNGDAQETLGRQAVHPIVVHGRQIVGGAIGESDDLGIGAVFDDLLQGAVHVADAYVQARDLLAVETGDKPHDAVGARVVGADVDEEILDVVRSLGIPLGNRPFGDIGRHLPVGSHRGLHRHQKYWGRDIATRST